MTVLKITRVASEWDGLGLLPIPKYHSLHSSGMDLYADVDSNGFRLAAQGGRFMCPTGLRVEIPVGYEGQIRPRSGLANQHGITVINSPGTIDSDYRGEIKVLLVNMDHANEFWVKRGERIAQLVIAPVARAEIVLVTEEALSSTERGEGGFGSTGTK